MNKLSMKQKATEIAREATRKKGISQTTEIMSHVPELIEAVEIDSEYIRNKVETELNKKTGNPVNALLRLMGLRIVSTRKATEELGLEEEQSFTIGFDEADGHMESMLKINQEKLSASSDKIADALSSVEANFRDERRKSKEQGSAVFVELDKKTQECAQLNADLLGQKTAVMEHAQYMLSLLGEDTDSPLAEQLTEMLEDIGVYVYWKAEDAPFSDSTKFTELKCDNPGSRRMKPCLASEDAVLMKGIRFVSKTVE